MSTWHIYSAETGHFVGRAFTGDEQNVSANVPAGCRAIAGVTDWRSQRVDLKTGLVVEWQPPAPADEAMRTWVWNDEARRWVDVPTLAALKAGRLARLQVAIDAQEAAQARPVRELLAAMLSGGQAEQAARDRFSAISTRITALQLKRAAIEAAGSAEELAAIPE